MPNSRRLARGYRLLTGCAVVAGAAILLGGATAGAAAAAPGSGFAARARAAKPAASPGSGSVTVPHGFWYGTDSSTIPISGGALPRAGPRRELRRLYRDDGNWARWQNCGSQILAWSSANAGQATANFDHHLGIGTGVYWFMGGPGVDPHYNGTAARPTPGARSRPRGHCPTRRRGT